MEFKVGEKVFDKVWCKRIGVIESIHKNWISVYFKCNGVKRSYTIDGRYTTDSKSQTLFSISELRDEKIDIILSSLI